MTVMHDLKKAVEIAKKTVLENLDASTIRTGEENPFGDKTLLLDQSAEDNVVEILQSSDTVYTILTEEKGMISSDQKPEYMVILDPIDGSANLERGIPLVSVGISAVPVTKGMTTDDVEISIIDSFFTEELYIAVKGNGATKNGKSIKPILEREDPRIIISYDTKKKLEGNFGRQSLQTLQSVHDMRRTGSNLLDLCWTASGALDAMLDLRDILPIVHVSGTHMVFEAGGFVLDSDGTRFCNSFDMNERMSFIAARDETLARSLFDVFMDNDSK
ncbi:MAG: inositol monophosphatase family protein [Candidatus Thorarchaeota archaeon]|jgi:myo-inositol-1(or 4)-monophosphatase